MDYRQAQRIRRRSLSDVIAANLATGQSVMGSIGSAISQKSAAKFTRIKEKFDPLNIIKFMTGGSKLAPALLGHLLGRSRRDIEYFSGTARILSGSPTAQKLGALPHDESNVGILTDIYNFMKKTQENEMHRFELKRNREEETKLENEKRHKKLIEAIKGFSGKPGTASSTTGGNLFDDILGMVKSMIGSMISSALTALEWISELKPLTLLIRSASFMRFLFNPMLMGPAALASALLGFIWNTREAREEIEKDPWNAKYDENPYALKLRGLYKGEGQAGAAIAQKTSRKMPRSYIQSLVDSDIPDADLISETGKNRDGLKQWLIDNPKRDAMFQGTVAPKVETKVAPVPPAAPPTPPVVPAQTSKGQELSATTKENQNLTLRKTTPTAVTKNELTNTQTQTKQNILTRLDKLSVRNPDETFQRMIYYSTRVV